MKGKAKVRTSVRDLSARKAEATKGGILVGMLLPAVQKSRAAADGSVRTGITDGTSNTIVSA